MTCWGNAHGILRRHRWQKLREGHNKWRADTHGTYGGGCKYRAEQTCSVITRESCIRRSWKRRTNDVLGREGLMTCWGNAQETLRRHRWQKRPGHNKWRADTHGMYGGGQCECVRECRGATRMRFCAGTDGRSSWERQEKDIISGGQTRCKYRAEQTAV